MDSDAQLPFSACSHPVVNEGISSTAKAQLICVSERIESARERAVGVANAQPLTQPWAPEGSPQPEQHGRSCAGILRGFVRQIVPLRTSDGREQLSIQELMTARRRYVVHFGDGFRPIFIDCSAVGLRDVLPRINQWHAGLLVSADVAGDDRQAMVQRRCCNDEIRLCKRVPHLAPGFHQQAPLEHNVFADGEDAAFKHGTQLLRKPVAQCGPLVDVLDQFDTKADFRERDGADKKAFERLRAHERHHLGFGARAPQFRQDVGVEQVAFHSDTSRTGAWVGGARTSSSSGWGEARSTSTSAAPVCCPCRRL